MYRYKPLLQSIHLPNGIKISNRFVLSPMTVNASTKKAILQKQTWFMLHVALIQLECKSPALLTLNHGQLFEYGFNIDHDACIPGLTNMASTMKQHGSLAIIPASACWSFFKSSNFKFWKGVWTKPHDVAFTD